MILKTQKRLAASELKCSPKRVHFDTGKLTEIKEAITRADIRGLIIDGMVKKTQVKNTSRVRIRARTKQRAKRRQKGHGSRKGRNTARLPKKERWINTIRIQRAFLKELKAKDKVNNDVYRELYRKAKGGFFRHKRHMIEYMTEKQMFKK